MQLITRKDHTCGFCGEAIKKGECVEFAKGRGAKLADDNETQIGIEYWSVYLHIQECQPKKAI